MECLSCDGNKANPFPCVSPCGQYIFHLSGWGDTHNFYFDGVTLQRTPDGWK